jgi:DnaJ-class molecular chaperone
MDHYKKLGVSSTASQDEIKQAFRTLSKLHHPDAGGNADEYKSISLAYQTLKDPARRRAYDAELMSGFNPGRQSHADPRAWGNFQDIFNEIFQQQQNRPRDIVVQLPLSPKEIYNGIKDRKLRTRYGDFTVTVPAGLRPGSTLTYDNTVPGSSPEQPPGKLTVQITSADSRDWQIHGDDVFHIIDVDCIDAVTGTEIEFEHLDGQRRRVKIPPGTQHGKQLRLQGLGLNYQRQGDLYVVTNLCVPTITDQTQLDLLKQIKRSK